jgi:hypothetical protein
MRRKPIGFDHKLAAVERCRRRNRWRAAFERGRRMCCGGSKRRDRLRFMLETALYPTVKRFLEAAGFQVKGEIHGCDIVAVHHGAQPQRLAIVEMKLGLNLDLLLQAVDRMRVADEIWLAVPATGRGRDRDPRVHRLCRLIGLGLMAVNPARDVVEVLTEPGPYRPRPDRRRRMRVLSEHARRKGDPSAGGSTRQPVMTAYRQRALACAKILRAGPGRPRELRVVAPDAGRILLRNVYGWFERIEPGVYRLSSAGEVALQYWGDGLSPRQQACLGEVGTDARGIECAPPRAALDALEHFHPDRNHPDPVIARREATKQSPA